MGTPKKKKSWRDYVSGFITLARCGRTQLGQAGQGYKDWVGKGFMRGPTCCHMCTEKQHLIVSSLGRPQGKEEPRKGTKAYRLPPRRTSPHCDKVHFGIPGGNVNFSGPKSIVRAEWPSTS